MKSTPRQLMELYGTRQRPTTTKVLSAGALAAVFDEGGLRTITYHGREVLRGIAYLVRDENWGTYPVKLSRVQLNQSKNHFELTYTSRVADHRQSLACKATITGTAAGKLTFTVTACPQNDFVTNRTGFIVLHPIEGVAGKPLLIQHDNGTKKSQFPKLISAGQPVFNIRALEHTATLGVKARVTFIGKSFEMEDQRNWMDASYKTYVGSLLDPWPYILPAGQPFTQSVTLQLFGKPTQRMQRTPAATRISFGGLRGSMPDIGTAIPISEAKATVANKDHVKASASRYLVAHLDGRTQNLQDACMAYADIQAASEKPVTLEVVLSAQQPAESEMAEIAQCVHTAKLVPEALVVTQAHDLKSFQPNTERPWGPTFEDMAAAARKYFPGLPIGGGMLSYFTELNRKRPPQGLFDFITHTVCPIVHDADDKAVMQCLQTLPAIFASTKSIAGATAYHLGPSGISCRDNPYGSDVAANPDGKRVCLAPNDPRQHARFGAAWNLGLAAHASRAALARLAIGAMTGPQGMVTDDGKRHPSFHVFAKLAALSGQRLRHTNVSDDNVEAITCVTEHGFQCYLANLTDTPLKVRFEGLPKTAVLQTLDGKDSKLPISRGTCELPAFACAVLYWN